MEVDTDLIHVRFDGQAGWVERDNVLYAGPETSLMTKILNVLIHVLVVGSILFMMGAIADVVDCENNTEVALRIGSVATGLLAYWVARAFGFTLPDLLVSGLTNPKASIAFTALFGIAVPGVLGAFVAWVFIRIMKTNADIGKPGILLFSTITLVVFIDVYARMAGEIGISHARYGLPNATFVLGMFLYTIFTYRSEDSKSGALSRSTRPQAPPKPPP